MLEKCENVKGSIKMLGRGLWQEQEKWIGREEDEELEGSPKEME